MGMNEKEILALAEALLIEHGLSDWQAQLDRARRRAGSCRYQERVITLSATLLPTYPREQIRDVILHEIAHAQVGDGHGHGPVWQQAASRLGANPKARLSANLPRPPATWVGTCPRCGRSRELYSAPRRVVSCGACDRNFDGKLVLEWHHRGKKTIPPGRYKQELGQIRRGAR